MESSRMWLSWWLIGSLMLGLCVPLSGTAAETGQPPAPVVLSTGASSINLTAERIEFLQEQEVYNAAGTVVVDQGAMHLTADQMTIEVLPGILIATGHVRLTDPKSELVSDRLELHINTEAGIVTHGEVYIKPSNTLVQGRLLQRFSEEHYRVKDGQFTNCDAREGLTPAWRFQFKDLDLKSGDNVGFTGGWFCVNDRPLIPLPTMTYPLTVRQSGLLIPTVAYDNRFGAHAQESFYWAINPSQELLISPFSFSSLGYGTDLAYSYRLDPKSGGQWFMSALQQNALPNVSAQTAAQSNGARAFISGAHTQLVTPDLLIRANIFYVTDPNYLAQLSNSGVQRALPSGENTLLATQRLTYGNVYLLGQYLQPLESGGTDTFQRAPELGYSLPNMSLLGTPILFGAEGTYVNFYRETGFTMNRVEMTPAFSTDVLTLGHVVGITPQVKVRAVNYDRGAESTTRQHRETVWASLDAKSKLSRRFGTGDGGSFLHTVEPSVVYEYVPSTDQSKLALIDQVDDLPKKSLLTYAMHSRVLEHAGNSSFNWLDLTVAQSYHVGATQVRARNFTAGVAPLLGSTTQPLQPATVALAGKKLSDIWMRAVIGNTTPQALPPSQVGGAQGVRAGSGLAPVPINQSLTVDTFFDPYRGTMSQFNTDFRLQQANYWYLEVGQRYSREGNRVRRGDVWNPISFNDVYAPTSEIQFLTAGGGFRTPWGWTIGAKAALNVKDLKDFSWDSFRQRSPEYDLVALYQNPCKCWSLGMYMLIFPDRTQYNFMFSLTGVSWTENYGTAVLRSLLGPLLVGEKGLPWNTPGGSYGRVLPQNQIPQPAMVGMGL